MVLHQSKSKCKSIKCNNCGKFYANERTLNGHSCEDNLARENMPNLDNESRVDQDIKVIKLDRKKLIFQVINIYCF